MSDNVYVLGATIYTDQAASLDIPVERVVSEALNANLNCAVVLGWDSNGECYVAATTGKVGDVLYLMETAKLQLLNAHSMR